MIDDIGEVQAMFPTVSTQNTVLESVIHLLSSWKEPYNHVVAVPRPIPQD